MVPGKEETPYPPTGPGPEPNLSSRYGIAAAIRRPHALGH